MNTTAKSSPEADEGALYTLALEAYTRGDLFAAQRLFSQVVALNGEFRQQADEFLLIIARSLLNIATGRSYRSYDRGDSDVRKALPDYEESPHRPSLKGDPPLVPPEIVQRTPHLTVPDDPPLSRGQRFDAVVYADESAPGPGEESDAIRLTGATAYDVEVWTAGTEHFDQISPRVAMMQIDSAKPDSTPLKFSIRVKPELASTDDAALFAYFFYRGRPCGKVRRAVSIQTVAPQQPLRQAPRLAIATNAAPPDLTIEVTDPTRTRQHLKVRCWSQLLSEGRPEEPADWDLSAETGTLVLGFMQEFMKPDQKPKELVWSLKGAGKNLFDATPPAFQKLYWELVDRGTPPTSILVVSEEPYVPWELIVPHRRLPDGNRDIRPALGADCAVGRWITDDHFTPKQTVPLIDCYVIAPHYPGPKPAPLKHAATEASMVLSVVPGQIIDPADLATIDTTLGARGASLLHFVCHGVAGTATGVQAMYVENGPSGVTQMTSLQVLAMEGMIAAAGKQPLIFLNACEVGRPSAALVGIGGFAKAFIDLGASGVIAPLWSVSDKIAADVATRFYHAVQTQTGRPFADILREIRQLAYTTGEDTYAAYAFYGDPNARAI